MIMRVGVTNSHEELCSLNSTGQKISPDGANVFFLATRERFVNAETISERRKTWLINVTLLLSDFKSSITEQPHIVACTKTVAVGELVAANDPPHPV